MQNGDVMSALMLPCFISKTTDWVFINLVLEWEVLNFVRQIFFWFELIKYKPYFV